MNITCRTPWTALVAGSTRSGVRSAGITLQKKTWTTADIIASAVWNHCTRTGLIKVTEDVRQDARLRWYLVTGTRRARCQVQAVSVK